MNKMSVTIVQFNKLRKSYQKVRFQELKSKGKMISVSNECSYFYVSCTH